MDYEKMRAAALGECDRLEEIDRAAAIIADAARFGEATEIVVAPGNGTRYAFLVVPHVGMSLYCSPREGLESDAVSGGGVWFAWLNAVPPSVYPLALIGRPEAPAPSYIAEKWQTGRVTYDTFVIELLFQKVGELTVPVAA